MNITAEQIVAELLARGISLVIPDAARHFSLGEAAARLDVSVQWVRSHLDEFPHAWRLPAGCAGDRNMGELRIPAKDIEEFVERQRIRRAH